MDNVRVTTLGTGRPSVVVVGAIHGDEPCGARAIERVLLEAPAVNRPVKFVVANERALERGVRQIDVDLNRNFDGDGDPRDHEHVLATRLAEELAGCLVLSLHSTQSSQEAFGIVLGGNVEVEDVAHRLPIEALVNAPDPAGRPFALPDARVIEVEAGYQWSRSAATAAYETIRAFLRATDVLSDTPSRRSLPRFELGAPVAKPPADDYEVFVENFSRVAAGEAYARADDRTLRAEAAFYPILFSAGGYRDIFGYAGERLEA